MLLFTYSELSLEKQPDTQLGLKNVPLEESEGSMFSLCVYIVNFRGCSFELYT